MPTYHHLPAGTPPTIAKPMGEYRLALKTQAWWWSAETYRMHGFEPGEVMPTTPLFLAHRQPEDREQVRDVLNCVSLSGGSFSNVHRIIDATGHRRSLVMVGHGRTNSGSQEIRELVGYFVDITSTIKVQAEDQARRDITAAATSRGPIDQAKGVIAGALGVDPEEVFQVLRRCSNNHNVPLRDLARLVVDEASHGRGDAEHMTTLLT